MGYNTDRFENKNDIDDDFICAICQDVLEDPVFFLECEHTFCRECIDIAMLVKSECPVDRGVQSPQNIRPILRYFKKKINQLRFYLTRTLLIPNKTITDSDAPLMDVKKFAHWKTSRSTKKSVCIRNVPPVEPSLLLLFGWKRKL